jgi:serine/threonine protein kinase
MGDEKRVFGGRWREIEQLGRGGQGVVYKVLDTSGLPSERDQIIALKQGLRNIDNELLATDPDTTKFVPLVDALRAITAPPPPKYAAVKELLPFEDAVAADSATALARMKNELEALASVDHPALLKVLDSNLDRRWFAIEYFEKGPLSKHRDRFKGDVRGAFRALRPIVEVVAALHAKNVVHRDIKPENVFVADDGHLVLGDCGLAIKIENQNRLTLTYENVGTRDYQPPWTYGMRVEDVKPNFDVFGLAKLLWAVISGRPRFPLEDFNLPQHDLREMFPNNPDILFAHRLLAKCVVRRELQMQIANGGELLKEFDRALMALDSGGSIPTSDGKMRCRFCGIGSYSATTTFAATGISNFGHNEEQTKLYICDNCGHLDMFVFTGRQTPPGWS